MKIKTLVIATSLLLPASNLFAAALDRSTQSTAAFLQPNNYFEASGAVLVPDVSGKDNNGNTVGDMGESYHHLSAAVKLQPNKHFSIGLLYDQPFGADATYHGSNNFVANNQGTEVSVLSNNLTLLAGFQPNENWNFYAGPQYQTIKGSVALRGSAYGATALTFSGYKADFSTDDGWGWVAGIAYQKPEIALKAALTYRSEVDHELDTTEAAFPVGAALGITSAVNSKTKITTPQSVNLDLQTGIMKDTVAFANIRWVNWKDFSIRPATFNRAATAVTQITAGSTQGFNLVDYAKDQWSATVGVGRKFSEKWSASTAISWDSGAGNPITTLGPIEGYWGLGLSAQYSPAKNYFVAGTVRYFWLGDATAKTGAGSTVGQFEDNTAIAYGLKVGYRF